MQFFFINLKGKTSIILEIFQKCPFLSTFSPYLHSLSSKRECQWKKGSYKVNSVSLSMMLMRWMAWMTINWIFPFLFFVSVFLCVKNNKKRISLLTISCLSPFVIFNQFWCAWMWESWEEFYSKLFKFYIFDHIKSSQLPPDTNHLQFIHHQKPHHYRWVHFHFFARFILINSFTAE